MKVHANAALGPAGRLALVQAIEAGTTQQPTAGGTAGCRQAPRLLASREIKHITTQPYRPQTNGKVERFHQTMAREWAYGMAYCSHRHRNRAPPHWLRNYNETRPHSSLGGPPPISRLHNVRGQDS